MFGILIPVEGDVRVVEHDGTWQSIAKVIGSQYIERVNLGLPDCLHAYVDEEGMVTNRPINARLSLFYPGISQGIFLHGDALLVQERVTEDGPDVCSIPEDEAQALARIYAGRLNRELERRPGLARSVAAHNAGL